MESHILVNFLQQVLQKNLTILKIIKINMYSNTIYTKKDNNDDAIVLKYTRYVLILIKVSDNEER